MVGSVAGGWLSDRYGAKAMIAGCGSVHVLVSMLTPTLSLYTPFYAVAVIRLFMGVAFVSAALFCADVDCPQCAGYILTGHWCDH
jgi:MFS family permease